MSTRELQEVQFNDHAQNCPKCWATLRRGSREVVCDKGAAILAKEICEAEASQRSETGTREPGEISDGYHTFNELYEHRHALFSVICAKFDGWKSMLHDDGTMFDGWFIAGVMTPKGSATYHLPIAWWERFVCPTLDRAPKWDGHTAQQVPERIASLAGSETRDLVREALEQKVALIVRDLQSDGFFAPANASYVHDRIMTRLAEAALREQPRAGAQPPSDVETRTLEEVLQLHIDSSESMLGVFQRTGDKEGIAMQSGVTAGLKRAIEVYGNWSARRATPAVERERELREAALKQFTEWFVANYPGPDTVIFKPEWHAPKIFRAVEAALSRRAGDEA